MYGAKIKFEPGTSTIETLHDHFNTNHSAISTDALNHSEISTDALSSRSMTELSVDVNVLCAGSNNMAVASVCSNILATLRLQHMYTPHYFAWRLVKHYFSDSELINKNCHGNRGKQPLNYEKLFQIRLLVFQYFPAASDYEEEKDWKLCVDKINMGIRNYMRTVKKT